ncbi:MAG: alpha/beta fold hydrolase [Polyangiaceae bacterium]
MILDTRLVEQAVDLGERALFVKQLLLARGRVPIAMVRKRAAREGENDTPVDALALPTRAAVLLIHGYGQNRYAFHLPSRSFVNHLARAGFDVYNVDLRGRGRSAHLGAERPGTVLDFVHDDVPAALDVIEALNPDVPVFLLGHSLGGIVSYCSAVEESRRVAGVVAMGAPYHFTAGSLWLTLVGAAFLAVDGRLDLPNLAVPARTYGWFVRRARPLVDSRIYPVPLRGFHRGSVEPQVLKEHMALAMDVGSISTMRGMFSWARQAKRGSSDDGLFGYERSFERLDKPLLVISGRYDDLAPPKSVEPAFLRSHSTDKTYREFPFGHVDMLVGREAPRLSWHLIEHWLRARSPALTEAVPSASTNALG